MSKTGYAGPHALVRALLGRLLGSQEERRLIAAPGVEDVLRQLEATPYAADLAGAGDSTLLPVEQALERNLVGAYGRVIRALAGAPRALVEEMLRRFEADNLKAILRGLSTGAGAEAMRAALVPLGRWERLPVDRLIAAQSVEEAVRALNGLPYARPLADALERYRHEQSLFPLEVALDLDYFRRLWARIEDLEAGDRASARRALGTRYDVINVAWLLRYRLLYRLSAQEIFNYTLPHGYRVDDEVIRRAAAATDLDGVIAALPEPYRGLLAPLGDASIARLEVALRRYLWRDAHALLAGYPFQIGVILSFLYLKEAEVRDLIAILEGKRHGRPPDAIEAFLWSEP